MAEQFTIAELSRTVWRIINCARTSTAYKGREISVRCNDSFRGLTVSRQNEINDMLENFQKNNAAKVFSHLDSLDDVKTRSANLAPMIINSYKTTGSLKDSIANLPTMANVQGQDPRTQNTIIPNIWMSPQEAMAVYTQKGLPETIINKKGKSPLLNGVRIKNPKLSPKQLDIIREDMTRNGLANEIVKGLLHSLIYGGSLLFPMFNHDTPLSLHLPVEVLARYGIVGKGCVHHWVTLDRWNCVHIPNWNPTSEEFYYPRHYYIPFLGAHVAGERGARIVTAPQIGYWAILMTLGWGISDIPGWIEAVYNYYNVMAAIPTMINQMSVIVRTLNVDSYLATEGWDMMRDIDFVNTARVRESSPNNIINMDVIGDLKALSRDFKEVPNLVRLIRQDVGGRANIPEELLFSSERGAFASGDTTEGAQEKQWESIRTLHRDVASQLKHIAMIEVVNALGKDRDVISALPYTEIEFDKPAVTNAETRAKIGTSNGKTLFDITAAGIPSDMALSIMQSYSDESFPITSQVLEELKSRQAVLDEREKEKHDKEMELLDAQIELTKEQAEHTGDAMSMGGGIGSIGGTGKHKVGGDSGYSRLEQHKKEKTRGTASRRVGKQRAASKKL